MKKNKLNALDFELAKSKIKVNIKNNSSNKPSHIWVLDFFEDQNQLEKLYPDIYLIRKIPFRCEQENTFFFLKEYIFTKSTKEGLRSKS